MEKLKPLIVYRFWVILGVVLMLPPIGWVSATGKLSAEIGTRINTLDGLKGAIPNGQGAPNDDWAAQAEKLVKNREVRNQFALKVLWDSQVKTRVWFPGISKFMSKCPYRGELADRNEKEQVPDLYRDGYDSEVARVWKIPFPKQDMSDLDRPKIVDFPLNRMPRVPATTWRGIVPTWPEIWNASEDLWLLEQLMLAVQRTNTFATNLTDANVKQIEAVELFGGRRLGPTDAPVATASVGYGEGGMPGGASPVGAVGLPVGGAAGTAFTAVTSAEFNIGEEYEVKSRTSATLQAGAEGFPGSPMPVMPGATTTAATNPSEGRYVQDTPAFRTRGFRLKVVVRQQNAMELVRELLNSKYPIEIIRIQQFALNPAFGASTSTGGGGFGGGFGGPPPGYPAAPGGFTADTTLSGDLGSGVVADPLAALGASGVEGVAATGSPQDALVYQDPHLISMVILGELYIYNEPKLPEANATDSNGSGVATPINQPSDSATTPSVVPALGEESGSLSSPTTSSGDSKGDGSVPTDNVNSIPQKPLSD